MQQVELLDLWGSRRPVREFWSGGGKRVLMFHDCVRTFPAMLAAGIIGPDTLIVQSSSWYRDKARVKGLLDILKQLEEAAPAPFGLSRNFLFLANSEEERASLKQALPEVPVLHVNNTAFLKEDLFPIGPGEKLYDAVLVSKPAPFKRMHLAKDVPNKIIISYAASSIRVTDKSDPVPVESLGAERVFWDLGRTDLVALLQRSRVGLILSAEEGACYSSTEYLLCGLPVVSTPSRGGRHDYYDEFSAEIVEPTPEAVAAGVARLLARLRDGAISPADIRARTVARMLEFRRRLAAGLEARLAALGVNSFDGAEVVAANIARSSKLEEFRNFWISGVAT
ncbi:glycosyltransferase [Siccirubricoccus phaeus]|uniref:glycosyltransferase n=1 Tax=Siccirubricoccus phaeus TaxID=2595053 RepID=UPI0011F33C9D|nr:glycosyltransferase [Siccirubricoccus phaeus]